MFGKSGSDVSETLIGQQGRKGPDEEEEDLK